MAPRRSRRQRQQGAEVNDDDVPMADTQQVPMSAIQAAWDEEQLPGGVLADTDGSEFGEAEELERKNDPHADDDGDSAIGREDEEDFGDPEGNREKYLSRLKASVRGYFFLAKSYTNTSSRYLLSRRFTRTVTMR